MLIYYMGKSFHNVYIYISNHYNTHIILQFINSPLIILGEGEGKHAYLLEIYTEILMNEMK